MLRCILRHCDVLHVRLPPQDLRALNLKFFTLPFDFAKLSFCDISLANIIVKVKFLYFIGAIGGKIFDRINGSYMIF